MSLSLAKIRNLVTDYEAEVQFNPAELTFSKDAHIAGIDIPGLDAPIQQFIRGGNETLNLELFFDTTDEGVGTNAVSVTGKVNEFYDLVKQNPGTHALPQCLFLWGPPSQQQAAEQAGEVYMEYEGEELRRNTGLVQAVSNAPFWFTCIFESVERRFVMFSSEGIPLRARVTVQMREYQTVEQMVARLESADHTRLRVLQRRQRLDQIAADAYHTPSEWRHIAEANDIDDPRRIVPGTELTIPPLRTISLLRREFR